MGPFCVGYDTALQERGPANRDPFEGAPKKGIFFSGYIDGSSFLEATNVQAWIDISQEKAAPPTFRILEEQHHLVRDLLLSLF